jgi:hypothetical protein
MDMDMDMDKLTEAMKHEITIDKDRRSLNNRTRLSWWFPRLPNTVVVPQTVIIPYAGNNLLHLFDGEIPTGFVALCVEIEKAGNKLGWPLFLRTDFLSGKHNWKNSCHVPNKRCIAKRVTHLVEESAMADIMGFPTDYWIARKFIPTKAAFSAFRGKMPIVKERRYFVQDARVVCHHPYWPAEAFISCKVPGWEELLAEMSVETEGEVELLSGFSSEVGAVIGGEWSIDWLWSEDECKWYLIDMAEADVSYHWEGCNKI